MFPSYRNKSVDLQTNQLTGFCMMGTLVVKRLNVFYHPVNKSLLKVDVLIQEYWSVSFDKFFFNLCECLYIINFENWNYNKQNRRQLKIRCRII